MDIAGNTMGITQRGLASVARAMGRVAGVIARALRLSRRSAVRRRELPERRALLAEIAGLENELDQVYYLVARGDKGLPALLSRKRALKDQLQRARAQLKRLDRNAAMDRRFLRSLTSGSRSADEDQPDIGKTVSLRERYDFDDEEGEYEFESLLDGDL